MARPDLNLLVTLDVLLDEGNVARAARRLRLSPSAMSRALARLRETTGDPLLVRAGRGLVPTPRAIALRDQVAQLVESAEAVLRPAATPDLTQVVRTFTIRAREGFVANFGAAMIARVAAEAPGVRLRFLPKLDRDSTALRDGTVDLETGVIGSTTGPEVKVQALFRDRFIGVVRAGHPLARGKVTTARYAAAAHVHVSRRGHAASQADDALAALGLTRRVAAIVGEFSTAVAVARTSDLVASVPERHTASLLGDMHRFALPVAVPEITVSLLWHPRSQADPVHRWLRDCIREVCAGP
jgi:DNA-binding transcriptional LysR family regulator